ASGAGTRNLSLQAWMLLPPSRFERPCAPGRSWRATSARSRRLTRAMRERSREFPHPSYAIFGRRFEPSRSENVRAAGTRRSRVRAPGNRANMTRGGTMKRTTALAILGLGTTVALGAPSAQAGPSAPVPPAYIAYDTQPIAGVSAGANGISNLG